MTIINMETKFDQRNKIVKLISAEWKGVIAEFLATMMLLFIGCLSNVPMDENFPNSPLISPLTFGMTVMFNIQIFGHLSGAYMNPFVTIIAVIWGRLSTVVGVVYIVAECAGAVLGYGLLLAMTPGDIASDGRCMTIPRSDIDPLQAVGVEIVLSLALSLINCAIWDPVNAHNTDSSPLKFGLTIIGLSLAGQSLTGASMNPARSLGPAVWSGQWDLHWVYWVGPLVGGVLPGIFYKYVWKQKTDPKLQD